MAQTAVLIITYYWPPSGGAGVQRWVKLTKYLSRMGVSCHVLTVDENQASYMILDSSLEEDIAPEVKVYKTDSFEPINYYARIVGKEKVPTAGFSNVDNTSWKQKVVNGLRSHLFIPDPRIGWKKYALKKARQIIVKHSIQTVITTSPPHSTQMIGLALKKEMPNLNWVADLRDPWTDIYYYSILGHSRWSHRINAGYEQSVLQKCDHLVTVSQGFADIFTSKAYPVSKDKITIVPNGFDPEDFERVETIKLTEDDKKTMVYTGTVSIQYDLDVLMKAIEHQKVDDIALIFVGILDEAIAKELEQREITYKHIPSVPHDEVLKYQKSADYLLLLIPDVPKNEGIVPGKIFEYMAAGKPIIGIGPTEGDAAQILQQTQRGTFYGKADEDRLNDDLLNHRWLNKHNIDASVAAYSRVDQARKIHELITS